MMNMRTLRKSEAKSDLVLLIYFSLESYCLQLQSSLPRMKNQLLTMQSLTKMGNMKEFSFITLLYLPIIIFPKPVDFLALHALKDCLTLKSMISVGGW